MPTARFSTADDFIEIMARVRAEVSSPGFVKTVFARNTFRNAVRSTEKLNRVVILAALFSFSAYIYIRFDII